MDGRIEQAHEYLERAVDSWRKSKLELDRAQKDLALAEQQLLEANQHLNRTYNAILKEKGAL